MAKITIQPCRIQTRSSSRISARHAVHETTTTSNTATNDPIKIQKCGSSENAISTTTTTTATTTATTTNNNNNTNIMTVTKSSSSNSSIHSNTSSSMASKPTVAIPLQLQSSNSTSKSHASLHYSSRAASPIIVPISSSSMKSIKQNTSVDGRPESRNSGRRVDRGIQQEPRSSQESSMDPTPIIDIARSVTPSAHRTTTSRRGGRSGPRSRSPSNTYRSQNPQIVSDSRGAKLSQTPQHRHRHLNGTVTPVGLKGSRQMRNNSSHSNCVKSAIPHSPKSPSSAAAAAAAAAKLLCDPSRMHHSASGASSWYGNGRETDGEENVHDNMHGAGGVVGDRRNGIEYRYDSNGRNYNRNGVDDEIQWSSHRSHFPRSEDQGYPYHDLKSRRPARSPNSAISQECSNQHNPTHHEALVEFGTSKHHHRHRNHYHEPHHDTSKRSRRYEEMESNDGALAKQKNETENIFQRQSYTERENALWNDPSGIDRYEDQEQDINNSGSGSDNFRNDNIPQRNSHKNEAHYTNRNRYHHDHSENEKRGGLVVVNRVKSSMMGMQKKHKASKESGGTSRVMGSPTPIHVPRASSFVATEDNQGNYPCKPHLQREGNVTNDQLSHSSERSSVFRMRPCNEDTNNTLGRAESGTHNCEQMASPQQLLLSLRSRTTSFEDKKKSRTDVDGKENYDTNNLKERTEKQQVTDEINQENRLILLSPKEPPRIHHSHNQRKIQNSLSFEPRASHIPRTPRTPNNNHIRSSKHNTVDVLSSPTFNLFDRSFDSPFVNAETYMQSSKCSTNKSPIETPQKFLKDLILYNQSFSPNSSPIRKQITTPRLPMRGSLSATNSPFLANLSFSPRPLQNYRSSSNPNTKRITGGTTSITSSPRASDNVEIGLEPSPGGFSINSVGDVGPNYSLSVMRKRKPPILPSAKEMTKVIHHSDRVVGESSGRRIMLGMCNRVRHTSFDDKGCSIPSKRDLSIGEEGESDGQEHKEKRLCTREGPTPLSVNDLDQASTSDIPVRNHSQQDPPRHDHPLYGLDQRQNLTDSDSRHSICSPSERDTPHDTSKSSTSREKNKTMSPSPSPSNGMNGPHFYQKLIAHKDAFQHFTFLLPALKTSMSHKTELRDLSKCHDDEDDDLGSTCIDQRVEESKKTEDSPPHRSLHMPQVSYSPDTQLPSSTTKPSNIVIARRRITSALCAFGGNNYSKQKNRTTRKKSLSKMSSKTSIFRAKRECSNSESFHKNSNCSDESKSDERTKYEAVLSNRYFENDNRISWEFEENPPIVLSASGLNNIKLSINEDYGISNSEKRQLIMDEEANAANLSPNSVGGDTRVEIEGKGHTGILPKIETKDDFSTSEEIKSVGSELSSKNHSDASMSVNSDQPKMRYRCKLCGKPKQNHTCPYQQSLQRSIGVTVYPAVNAYTACEPGILAPTLSEMNNFVHGQDGFTEHALSRPDRMITHRPTGPIMACPSGVPRNVTPGPVRSAMQHPSSSPLSNLSHTPHRTPYRVGPSIHYPPPSCPKIIVGQPTTRNLDRRNRVLLPPLITLAQDLLFVDSTELRPEQYRIVSSSVSHYSFEYPPLPLPYAQRKKLSDNLFALSKGIPQLTDECAAVLREARDRDLWDIAVAELMTQVIVVIHCPENDHRLDGLSQYLLSLRFAC